MAEFPSSPDFDARRPFRRSDAIAAGIEAKLIRGSTYKRIFRGVYVSASTSVTPKLRAEPALRLFAPRKAYLSHASAARIHGLPVPTLPDEHVTVLLPNHRLKREGVTCRVNRAGEVLTRDGVLVSSPRQMFAEFASILGLVDLVVVGDRLVKLGLITPEALIDFCKKTHLPHADSALRAARLVRCNVKSPMETRLRLLIVLAGLPEPRVNLALRAFDGQIVREYDLSYPEVRVIIEYDGRQHAEVIANWEKDTKRRRSIADDDWALRTFTSSDIYRTPGQTLQEIWSLLQRSGLPGVPTRLREDWRPHFPGW